MTDPRLPVAVRALEVLHDTSPDPVVSNEERAAAILAALPQPQPGDLALMQVAGEPSKAEVDFLQRLGRQLQEHGVLLIALGDAELTITPPAEEAWRAAWNSRAAAQVAEFAEELEAEAGRHRNNYERNAWAGAAERLREAAPRFLLPREGNGEARALAEARINGDGADPNDDVVWEQYLADAEAELAERDADTTPQV